MRHVTGAPIKFAGVSEKIDGLEPFHPERMASRILGMGDVVSLVERAAETIQADEAEAVLGESLTSSVVLGTLLPVVSAGLIAASTDRELPVSQRLTMPAIAASLATISGSICLQQARRPAGRAIALGGALLSFPLQLTLSYLPVRAALRHGWRKDHHA